MFIDRESNVSGGDGGEWPALILENTRERLGYSPREDRVDGWFNAAHSSGNSTRRYDFSVSWANGKPKPDDVVLSIRARSDDPYQRIKGTAPENLFDLKVVALKKARAWRDEKRIEQAELHRLINVKSIVIKAEPRWYRPKYDPIYEAYLMNGWLFYQPSQFGDAVPKEWLQGLLIGTNNESTAKLLLRELGSFGEHAESIAEKAREGATYDEIEAQFRALDDEDQA
ncbi:hypothetical protein MPC4_80026 [Methylocella tundrae]|uniref:Uncharacterized protein n=1 Tax=Methylocella tundrae TaxID=227605 RepID=A0A8B6MCM2_METTU|nr:hypothetical protein [Methylocella tundrae]VTZ26146.1 hypothetical protein MPC1_2910002 [Methylocella tundrae]VTZ52355.1 hypothetical protein MPC4_80026 [Methylocella tundrae]